MNSQNQSKSPDNETHSQHIPSVYPRGIFLLPSILTGVNIILGYYAIVLVCASVNEPIPAEIAQKAALMIILASIFDAIDGRIARLTNTTSTFGAQLDSIADVISFGVAPSILVYRWGLLSFPRFGWIASLFFLLAGAIRLARFNALEEDGSVESKSYFVGLPIPVAAISIALSVRVFPELSDSFPIHLTLLVLVYSLSFLMVSSCPFRSFKDIEWKKRRSVGTFFVIILLLLIVLHEPFIVMSILMCLYIISGIVMRVSPEMIRRWFRKSESWIDEVKILDDDINENPSQPSEIETDH